MIASNIIEVLNQKIAEKHLLKHPFYVAWSEGRLPVETLRHYSQQYFAHVRAFPAYLSEAHSRCEDLDARQVIAANLADEEATPPTHPQLWLDFAAGLGVSRESVLAAEPGPRMKQLIETFREVAKMDSTLAMAGLYCYEKQIPDVAAAKIEGLQKNYGIEDTSTLKYFAVHQEADVEHARQWEQQILRGDVNLVEAEAVADMTLNALWAALDEVYEFETAATA